MVSDPFFLYWSWTWDLKYTSRSAWWVVLFYWSWTWVLTYTHPRPYHFLPSLNECEKLNSIPKASSRGEGCSSFIYSNLVLLLDDVRLDISQYTPARPALLGLDGWTMNGEWPFFFLYWSWTWDLKYTPRSAWWVVLFLLILNMGLDIHPPMPLPLLTILEWMWEA